MMTDHSAPRGPRTLVAGDSWVCGLSKGQGTLSRMLPEAVAAREVLNISKISRIATDIVADHLDEVDAFAPDLAFLAVGGADSLVFPKPFFQRFIDKHFPPKWQGIEGLQPSAKIVRDRKKRIRHNVESFLKALLKQAMINLFGGHRRVSLEQFEVAVRTIMRTLDVHGTHVVLIGCSDVDGWTSPRSTKNIRATSRLLAKLAEEHPRALYVDSNQLVSKWDSYLVDHVHLTRDGHKGVCAGVVDTMIRAGGRWAEFARPAVHRDAFDRVS